MEIILNSLTTDHLIRVIKLIRSDIVKMVDPDATLGLKQAKEIADGLRDRTIRVRLDVPDAYYTPVTDWLKSHGFGIEGQTPIRTISLASEVQYRDPDPGPELEYRGDSDFDLPPLEFDGGRW